MKKKVLLIFLFIVNICVLSFAFLNNSKEDTLINKVSSLERGKIELVYNGLTIPGTNSATISAKVDPAFATNNRLSWKMEWADSSGSSNISTYLIGTVSNDTLTYKITKKNTFTKGINVIAYCQNNPSIYATCLVECHSTIISNNLTIKDVYTGITAPSDYMKDLSINDVSLYFNRDDIKDNAIAFDFNKLENLENYKLSQGYRTGAYIEYFASLRFNSNFITRYQDNYVFDSNEQTKMRRYIGSNKFDLYDALVSTLGSNWYYETNEIDDDIDWFNISIDYSICYDDENGDQNICDSFSYNISVEIDM